MKISYPTVNSRLNDVLVALGYGDRAKGLDASDSTAMTPDRRRELLTDVRDGKISAAEADRILRG
jgi:hypothetical protein